MRTIPDSRRSPRFSTSTRSSTSGPSMTVSGTGGGCRLREQRFRRPRIRRVRGVRGSPSRMTGAGTWRRWARQQKHRSMVPQRWRHSSRRASVAERAGSREEVCTLVWRNVAGDGLRVCRRRVGGSADRRGSGHHPRAWRPHRAPRQDCSAQWRDRSRRIGDNPRSGAPDRGDEVLRAHGSRVSV